MRAYPVATVHDSVEVVCHRDEVKKCLQIIYDELVNYPFVREKFNIEFDIPLKIDAEVGHSFGDGMEVDFNQEGIPMNVKEICQHLS
jgi:hypothetical protein